MDDGQNFELCIGSKQIACKIKQRLQGSSTELGLSFHGFIFTITLFEWYNSWPSIGECVFEIEKNLRRNGSC